MNVCSPETDKKVSLKRIYQLKSKEKKVYHYVPWIPEVPGKTESGTSGSAEHPNDFTRPIRSQYPNSGIFISVIGQILTGDPHFYNTMFWLHYQPLRVK